MKIHEKYTEALKSFTEFVTVYEWAQKVGELYPDLLVKAEKEAQAQKQNTTGLREIAARISSRLSSGKFKNVLIDESERPRKVKYLTIEEQQSNQKKELINDIEPIMDNPFQIQSELRYGAPICDEILTGIELLMNYPEAEPSGNSLD